MGPPKDTGTMGPPKDTGTMGPPKDTGTMGPNGQAMLELTGLFRTVADAMLQLQGRNTECGASDGCGAHWRLPLVRI